MDVLTAKKLVIEAGEKLVESGLIARTWGNVSCRVDDKTFVITPSGKPYIGLTPEDIVEVAIDSLEWSGGVKPSSEKGIHAEVYKEYPGAGFVIHTHQKVASVISALRSGIETVTGEAKKLIGDRILIGSYGLPGTKKLRKGVTKALRLSPSKAVIMAHHGALCFGRDSAEAFAVAETLEKLSTEYLLNSAKEKLGIKADNLNDFCTKIADRITKSKKTVEIDESLLYNSSCNRDDGKITLTNKGDGSVASMDLKTGEADKALAPSADAHRSVYLAYPSFNYIIHNTSSEVAAVSRLGKNMKLCSDLRPQGQDRKYRQMRQGAQRQECRPRQGSRRSLLRRCRGRRSGGRYDNEQELPYPAGHQDIRQGKGDQPCRGSADESCLSHQVL